MVGKGILVDTGPLVALLSERDQHHVACLTVAQSLRGPFLTCWPVVTEAVYLLRHDPTTVRRLLGQITESNLRLLAIAEIDVKPISEILDKYADQHFDLADATLMYLAERENIQTVFTVDPTHFGLYRSSQGESLTIVPNG